MTVSRWEVITVKNISKVDKKHFLRTCNTKTCFLTKKVKIIIKSLLNFSSRRFLTYLVAAIK